MLSEAEIRRMLVDAKNELKKTYDSQQLTSPAHTPMLYGAYQRVLNVIAERIRLLEVVLNDKERDSIQITGSKETPA